jgi:hypothetical protein
MEKELPLMAALEARPPPRAEHHIETQRKTMKSGEDATAILDRHGAVVHT